MELLMVIALLVVFMGYMSTLFVAQVRALEGASERQSVGGRWDQLLRQMRTDMWNASVMVVEHEQTFMVSHIDGTEIRWLYDQKADRILRVQWQGDRVVSNDEWPEIIIQPRFEDDDGVLVVVLPHGTPYGGIRQCLISQVHLAAEGDRQ